MRRLRRRRLRTGTIVTTDDRNWELLYAKSALRFSQSRAVGIDMESATIAAQGYRFRVPYGTLLCVSDKPMHGELKLPGQANRFYERAINEHMRIGHDYADVRQVLLYSTGLDDQEFVVAYETEDLQRFSQLVTALRDTEARRYTLRDTPIVTGVHRSLPETLELIG